MSTNATTIVSSALLVSITYDLLSEAVEQKRVAQDSSGVNIYLNIRRLRDGRLHGDINIEDSQGLDSRGFVLDRLAEEVAEQVGHEPDRIHGLLGFSSSEEMWDRIVVVVDEIKQELRQSLVSMI